MCCCCCILQGMSDLGGYGSALPMPPTAAPDGYDMPMPPSSVPSAFPSPPAPAPYFPPAPAPAPYFPPAPAPAPYQPPAPAPAPYVPPAPAPAPYFPPAPAPAPAYRPTPTSRGMPTPALPPVIRDAREEVKYAIQFMEVRAPLCICVFVRPWFPCLCFFSFCPASCRYGLIPSSRLCPRRSQRRTKRCGAWKTRSVCCERGSERACSCLRWPLLLLCIE